MHDERVKITHENGRSNLDDLWRSAHVQDKRKKEGTWDFCQGCTIWCYFEPSFYWPPDKYFWLHMKSKGSWAKQLLKLKIESKTGIKLSKRLAPLAAAARKPLEIPVTIDSPVKIDSHIISEIPVTIDRSGPTDNSLIIDTPVDNFLKSSR